MKSIVRPLQRVLFVMSCSMILFLTSCSKKENAPQTADQRVDSVMKQNAPAAAAPAPDASAGAPSASVTLNDKAKKGQALYYNTSLGKFKMSCSSCHDDGSAKTKDGHTRPGHTLVGVTSRTATWNGMFKGADLKKNGYGASMCIAGFMVRAEGDMSKALSADEADALCEYLAAISTPGAGMTKNLNIQWAIKPVFGEDKELDQKVTKPIVKAIMKLPGDPAKGQAGFQGACSSCHDIAQKKVGPSMKDAAQDMNLVVQAVRCGSNAMPFFAKDVLNDQQIADIVAYIASSVKK